MTKINIKNLKLPTLSAYNVAEIVDYICTGGVITNQCKQS